MEADQFISLRKADMKVCKLCRRNRDGSSYQVCSQEGQQETNEAEEDNILLKKLSNYFRYFSVSFLFLVTILDSHSCWGHDQLGRMGEKSLQLEDDNKTSHCSQLRYMGNFLELYH